MFSDLTNEEEENWLSLVYHITMLLAAYSCKVLFWDDEPIVYYMKSKKNPLEGIQTAWKMLQTNERLLTQMQTTYNNAVFCDFMTSIGLTSVWNEFHKKPYVVSLDQHLLTNNIWTPHIFTYLIHLCRNGKYLNKELKEKKLSTKRKYKTARLMFGKDYEQRLKKQDHELKNSSKLLLPHK